MSFDKSVELLGKLEGFESFDKDDLGGYTKYGLTKRAFPELNFNTLTWEKAKKVYFDAYWTPLRADELDPQLAQVLFIFAVNSSAPYTPKRAVKMLQSTLNTFLPSSESLEVDGIVGSKTVEASKKVSSKYPEALKMALVGEIFNYYKNIVAANSTQQKFLIGWFKRLFKSVVG